MSNHFLDNLTKPELDMIVLISGAMSQIIFFFVLILANFVSTRYLILRQLKTIILIRFPEITT